MKLPLLLVAALLACGSAAPASGDDTLPLGTFLTGARQNIERQCEAAKRRLELESSGSAREAARPAAEIICNCFPAELEKVAEPHGGMASTTRVSKDLAMGIAKSAYAACGARSFRGQAQSACLRDDKAAAGISDRSAYCACISESLSQVSDEKLADASVAAYTNFLKKAQARQRGEPDPKVEPTVVDEVTHACRQKHHG